MSLSTRLDALEAFTGPQRPPVNGLQLFFRLWSGALDEWTRERSEPARSELVLYGTAIERKQNAGNVLPAEEAARFEAWRADLGEPLENMRAKIPAGWMRNFRES